MWITFQKFGPYVHTHTWIGPKIFRQLFLKSLLFLWDLPVCYKSLFSLTSLSFRPLAQDRQREDRRSITRPPPRTAERLSLWVPSSHTGNIRASSDDQPVPNCPWAMITHSGWGWKLLSQAARFRSICFLRQIGRKEGRTRFLKA